MVHRARRESHGSQLKMGAVANSVPAVATSTFPPESSSIPACQCSAFLDPYPSPQAHWSRNVPAHSALAHYCRVCNTQLNSCKQARIHVTGKKHEKRLAYLKFSLDTVSDTSIAASYTSQYLATSPQHPILPTGLPTVYAYPPPPSYSQGPAYYYPSPVQPYPYYHDYPQCGPPPSQPPGQAPPPTQHTTRGGSRRMREGVPGGAGQGGGANHGVMSPSLTSGFSGSGDCKSTETCSLLSVASYSSATPAEKVPPPPVTRHVVSCEVCQLPFPSRAVLDHHLVGSRHARKVKAESVLRQLQEGGAEFRGEATGDIRCEVCEVSVNSSHQLQAHMTGHKHKMRCARQGVAPHRTILTPASSTAPSTTPSEASAPVRSHSVLVGRPQFGSRPNLCKTASASAKSGLTSRSRERGGSLAARVQKMRKMARPRTRVCEVVERARRERDARGRGEAGEEGRGDPGAREDSTTESDEPGNSKETATLANPEEESDEAKESEADPVEVGSMAKSSQTEPLGRRYSTSSKEREQQELEQEREDEEEDDDEEVDREDKPEEKEKQGAATSRPLAYPALGANFQCNICQISLNSQSQVAQHMGSNKHRRIGALAGHRGARLPGKEGTGRRECNVREIPMLSMFLQRLHQHHYFPPIRDEEDGAGTETHR